MKHGTRRTTPVMTDAELLEKTSEALLDQQVSQFSKCVGREPTTAEFAIISGLIPVLAHLLLAGIDDRVLPLSKVDTDKPVG